MSSVNGGILEAWLASTDDGAIAADASGRVVLHNPAASRVTGVAPGAALGLPWREVLRLDDGIADALWQTRVGAEPTRLVTDVLCAQGNLRAAEITATPWRDAGGQVGVLVLIRDLAVLCRQRTAPAAREGYGNLVGAHPSMQALYDLIEVVAPSDAAVVIEGEPGVGKELVAQLLHARSRRAERPFVAVNCAALPPDSLDWELFGHVRGTLGGAVGTAIGRVELAHTGTIFLDGVTELPSAVQIRLLRLLGSGEIERVGDTVPRRVDVRVIAAASKPLDREVQAGRFRDDLYYRLKMVRLVVPPLRERLSDLPLLIDHFLARYTPPGVVVSPAALALLQAYRWPGNVRELENVIRHAAAMLQPGEGGIIGPELLPIEIRTRPEAPAPLVVTAPSKEDRRALLLRALSSHGGNRTAAARSLGIGRATFYRWWREAGLASGAFSRPSSL